MRDDEQQSPWSPDALGQPFDDGQHPCFYPASSFKVHHGKSLQLPPEILLSQNFYKASWEGSRKLKNAVVLLDWIPVKDDVKVSLIPVPILLTTGRRVILSVAVIVVVDLIRTDALQELGGLFDSADSSGLAEQLIERIWHIFRRRDQEMQGRLSSDVVLELLKRLLHVELTWGGSHSNYGGTLAWNDPGSHPCATARRLRVSYSARGSSRRRGCRSCCSESASGRVPLDDTSCWFLCARRNRFESCCTNGATCRSSRVEAMLRLGFEASPRAVF